MRLCSRADLLAAMTALPEAVWPELAAGLAFVPKAHDASEVAEDSSNKTNTREPGGSVAGEPVSGEASTATTGARTPLRQALFGITEWHSHPSAPLLPPGSAAPPAAQHAPLEDADFAPTGSAPPAPALVTRAQLARHLPARLAAPVPTRTPDLARLLPQLARLRLPARVPLRLRTHLPARVWLVVERSHATRTLWADQTDWASHAARLLGGRALWVALAADDPFYPVGSWCAGEDQPFAGWPRPLPDLLLLHCAPSAGKTVDTALDSAADSAVNAAPPTRWQQFAAWFAARGVRVQWLAGPQLLPQATPPAGETLPADALDLLLTLAACARRIEPGLLRALRLLHPQLAHLPQLEAAVWQHPDLLAGYDVAVWRAQAVPIWRARFAGLDAKLQIRVWQTLADYHAGCGQWIRVQEDLTLAAYAKKAAQAKFATPIAEAEKWLQRLLDSPAAHAEHAGFVLLAGQTAAACEYDTRLRQSAPGLNRLAEIAGAAQYGASPKRRYWLRQQRGQLILCADVANAHMPGVLPGSPMGMPLLLDTLTVGVDGVARVVRPEHADGAVTLLANLRDGMRVRLAGADFQCTVAQVWLDVATAGGRDQYGMFAVMQLGGVALRWRWMEAGAFWMGSPEDEHERGNNETLHHVTLRHGYWLAETACTQALWQAVAGRNPSYFHAEQGCGPEHPVERVSWRDVQQWCSTVNETTLNRTGWQIGLPTEAEWEYACRAGTRTAFWFGDDIDTNLVNYDGDFPYLGENKGKDRGKTVAVTALPCNGWGLFQMHGNVWEWCADVYRRELLAGDDPGVLEVFQPSPTDNSARVLRGGSWNNLARNARAAVRYGDEPGRQSGDVGWRAALRSRQR